MRFRYIPVWLFWPSVLFCVALTTAVGVAGGVGCAELLQSFWPAITRHPVQIMIAILIGGVCQALVGYAIISLNNKLKNYYPGEPLLITKEAIEFSLPIGISGRVLWLDVESLYCFGHKFSRSVYIKFRKRTKLSYNGTEEYFDNVSFYKGRIVPSGALFYDLALKQHRLSIQAPAPGQSASVTKESSKAFSHGLNLSRGFMAASCLFCTVEGLQILPLWISKPDRAVLICEKIVFKPKLLDQIIARKEPAYPSALVGSVPILVELAWLGPRSRLTPIFEPCPGLNRPLDIGYVQRGWSFVIPQPPYIASVSTRAGPLYSLDEARQHAVMSLFQPLVLGMVGLAFEVLSRLYSLWRGPPISHDR
jgi:hypothetical protein